MLGYLFHLRNLADSTVIQGDLPHPVHVDESTWTLSTLPVSGKASSSAVPPKQIEIHLDKVNKMEWWAHVITNAPKIDVTKITPENSKLCLFSIG